MKLGNLIKSLEELPQESRITILVRGRYYNPSYLHSYRGYYDQLALSWDGEEKKKVCELLEECKSSVGKVFTGWKGGDFMMDENTPVWISNGCGECDNLIIQDIKKDATGIVIKTMENEYEY